RERERERRDTTYSVCISSQVTRLATWVVEDNDTDVPPQASRGPKRLGFRQRVLATLSLSFASKTQKYARLTAVTHHVLDKPHCGPWNISALLFVSSNNTSM
ncbi:unnamed protein product, partial [Ectocarpus fasciculatus]